MLRFLIALASVWIAGPASAQTVWRMPTEYPASAIPGEGVAHFAKLIAGSSQGALVVEPSYDASLGIRSADMIAAVRDGMVEAADAFGGALAPIDPVFGLSSLPFVVPSVGDAQRLAQLARPAYERALAAQGARLLYMTPWPPTGLWSKTALTSVDDLRRLTVRTYDATSTRVMAGAGVRAVSLSFADAMPKLRDGSVDAVLSSGDGGAGRRLWDLLPHFTEIGYAIPLSFAIVSTKAYEALPPDLRRAVDVAAAATEMRQWQAVPTRLDENYARMRQNGVAIRQNVDPAIVAVLRDGARNAIAEWRQGADPETAALLAVFERR